MSLGKNFWDQVKKTAGCWLWTGRQTHGYGQIGINKRIIYVHRLVWLWFNGAIPDGLEVLHKCDVSNCVNPAHLFLGTQRDNIKDCVQKGRHRPVKVSEWDVREIAVDWTYQ